MQLASIRILTTDLPRLVQFYEQATGLPATHYTPDFAELPTPAATLAIGSLRTAELFGGAHMAAAANRSVIIEFYVADVDAAYERIAGLPGPDVVQVPTTMPWGNRSLLFRDPDGNLVNFFMPVTPAAQQRFSRQQTA
ncbi:VOC family protein [Hymenobacter ginsengisoli]|uniref:VOC family protein n=1 Tax=Hymenobacter ginsengisoli TaxID=1051626 RepID=A0ABP8Q0V5_9BACT|nr:MULTISPECIES: VOC family protein [unclassified Hymenobacter]MBO2030665.1 VOC family protein [Hymenobacter sp. BT559]